MSEYQYLVFRAVDRPLTDRELKYARKQSTRAEIDQWSFRNEYNFGDFRGDAKGLLNRGYDVHLHYADFGIRTIMMTLPTGLPCDESIWSQFINGESTQWLPNASGGGILAITPGFEPGYLHDVWEYEPIVRAAVQVRNEIIQGDLRSLFVVGLCGAEDMNDSYFYDGMPPVPAGVAEASHACRTLLEFYGESPLMLQALEASTETAPSLPSRKEIIAQWLSQKSKNDLHQLATELLEDDGAARRVETLARIRNEVDQPIWPVSPCKLTWEELRNATGQLVEEEKSRIKAAKAAAARREAEKQEKQRQRRLKKMKKNPEQWLAKAETIVESRETRYYDTVAELLADLQEAVGGETGRQVAQKHAEYLTRENPTLKRLKSSLRKNNLL